MDEFKTLHQNEFRKPDPFDKLALEYHEKCERYDREVCSKMMNGSAMPANENERRLITQNSKNLISLFAHLALNNRLADNITEANSNLHKAITRTARYFERDILPKLNN